MSTNALLERIAAAVEDLRAQAPVYDWTREPYVLEIEDVARILRRSVTTLRREIQAGTMTPPPMPRVGKTTPYQWSREEVRKFVDERGYQQHDASGARRRRYFGKARIPA